MRNKIAIVSILLCALFLLSKVNYAQNQTPVVQNVTFTQRTDSTFKVDVYYNVNDPDGDDMTITIQVSDDNGASWNVSCDSVSGDIGSDVSSGSDKHIVWDFAAEHPQTFGEQFRIKIIADDDNSTGTVTDIDGNVYKTIKIGDQWWMIENLKVTHYQNGDSIPNVITGNDEWAGLSTGAYCIYNNNASYTDTYGYLYNWYAVDDNRNIAPAGWHVPTDEEWKQLEMYLGMSQSEADNNRWRGTNEGSKMAGNASLWYYGDLKNNAAFSESGLSALPGGFCYLTGTFSVIGYYAYFWSSSEYSSSTAWFRGLDYDGSDVYRDVTSKRYGFSVRCVRD